jgi:putative ABC transport system substrate-binding protein
VPAIADEIPSLNLDVVISLGAALLGLRDRVTIPLVYAFSGDPIAAGLADSLSRPRGNMTGITLMAADLNEKRLELLREMVPSARRIVLTGNPLHPGAHIEVQASESMAQRLGMDVQWRPIRNNAELEILVAEIEKDAPDALVMLPDMLMLGFRDRIARFAIQHRLPTASGWSAFAHSGGLFTYGPRLPDAYRRLASFVDRILKGAKPAELPIERPTVFELVLNLKTARAIGVTVPASLLTAADEVIE